VAEFTVERDGVELSGEEAGEGIPVVLLHGLTATRRYVVMGSRALERGGHRVVGYDARGHGRSAPAGAPDDYGYETLAADLLAVLDARGIDSAVLAGASMGAHTIVRLALDHGDRIAGLVLITPAYTPEGEDRDLARWDALSDGLREGGVEGFVSAYGDPGVPEAWRETVTKVLRQRLSAHDHPDAVADALRVVPRSSAF
jgi:pimeloyl-ACP methyl ester carboxylesterase